MEFVVGVFLFWEKQNKTPVSRKMMLQIFLFGFSVLFSGSISDPS